MVVLITWDWVPESRHDSQPHFGNRCPHTFSDGLTIVALVSIYLLISELMFSFHKAYLNMFSCLFFFFSPSFNSPLNFLSLVPILFCTWFMHSSFTILMPLYGPFPSFIPITALYALSLHQWGRPHAYNILSHSSPHLHCCFFLHPDNPEKLLSQFPLGQCTILCHSSKLLLFFFFFCIWLHVL